MLYLQVASRCSLDSCDLGMECYETCTYQQGYECIGKSNTLEDQDFLLQLSVENYDMLCVMNAGE